jgi:hypothetical protein
VRARRLLTTLGARRLGWATALALAGIAGVVLRVWAYRSVAGTPNADEAVVGLMARHVLDGELTTFYWGQAYGGTQEVLLTAPVFLVAGSGWLALRAIPIVLDVLASVIVWRVGRRTIGEPAATAAALAFWVWPAFDVYVLTHQQGFYASNVVYCSLLLLLALRAVERPDRLRVGLLGLVLGLAFWQTPQIVPVAAGVLLWTVWKRPGCVRQAPVALPLALLGAAPWLVWNARHGWESLAQPDYGDKLESLRLLASPVLPMIVGLRAPFSAELLLPAPLTYLVYVLLVGAFCVAAVRTRGRLRSLLFLVTAVFPLVYLLSPKTSLALGTPRFVVVLTPILALLLAQLATTHVRAVAVLAVALVVSAVTFARMEDWFEGMPRQTTYAEGLGPRHPVQWVPRNLGPLVAVLDRLGLRHVYAEYWTAYRLDFDTGERIVAAESSFDRLTPDRAQATPVQRGPSRRPEYERQVRLARHGFVFYRETVDTVPIVPQLERRGYRAHRVGSFVVYAPPGRK